MNIYSRLIASTALTAALIHFQPISDAKAAPQGGAVVGGQATIGQSGTTTTITQSTNRAAINWQSFNVAADETVTFAVPTNGATLNRVLGNAATTIQGTVQSNGTLILVNPNGLVFETGSKITAQNFVATTAEIDPGLFMAGTNPQFSAHANLVGNGKITLKGEITTADRGVIGIFAPQILNTGKISARLGSVTLAGGMNSFVIDFDGNGLINFEISPREAANLQRVAIENEGTISANGGQILMQANAASNLLNAVLSNRGDMFVEQVEDEIANAANAKHDITMNLYSDTGVLDMSGTLRNNAKNGSVSIIGTNQNVNISGNISVGTSDGSNSGIYVGQGGVFNASSHGNLNLSSNVLFAGGMTRLDGHNITALNNFTTTGDADVVIHATRNVMFENNLTLSGKYASIEGYWIETKGRAVFGGGNSFLTAEKIDFLDDVRVTGGNHRINAWSDVRLTMPDNQFEVSAGAIYVSAGGLIYSNNRNISGGTTNFSAKTIENNGDTVVSGGVLEMTAREDMFNHDALTVTGGSASLKARSLDLYGVTTVSGGTLNLTGQDLIAEIWQKGSTHITGTGSMVVNVVGSIGSSAGLFGQENSSEDVFITKAGAVNYKVLRNNSKNVLINAKEINLDNISLTKGTIKLNAGEFKDITVNITPIEPPPAPVVPVVDVQQPPLVIRAADVPKPAPEVPTAEAPKPAPVIPVAEAPKPAPIVPPVIVAPAPTPLVPISTPVVTSKDFRISYSGSTDVITNYSSYVPQSISVTGTTPVAANNVSVTATTSFDSNAGLYKTVVTLVTPGNANRNSLSIQKVDFSPTAATGGSLTPIVTLNVSLPGEGIKTTSASFGLTGGQTSGLTLGVTGGQKGGLTN